MGKPDQRMNTVTKRNRRFDQNKCNSCKTKQCSVITYLWFWRRDLGNILASAWVDKALFLLATVNRQIFVKASLNCVTREGNLNTLPGWHCSYKPWTKIRKEQDGWLTSYCYQLWKTCFSFRMSFIKTCKKKKKKKKEEIKKVIKVLTSSGISMMSYLIYGYSYCMHITSLSICLRDIHWLKHYVVDILVICLIYLGWQLEVTLSPPPVSLQYLFQWLQTHRQW